MLAATAVNSPLLTSYTPGDSPEDWSRRPVTDEEFTSLFNRSLGEGCSIVVSKSEYYPNLDVQLVTFNLNLKDEVSVNQVQFTPRSSLCLLFDKLVKTNKANIQERHVPGIEVVPAFAHESPRQRRRSSSFTITTEASRLP